MMPGAGTQHPRGELARLLRRPLSAAARDHVHALRQLERGATAAAVAADLAVPVQRVRAWQRSYAQRGIASITASNAPNKDRNTKSNTISKQTFKPFDEVRIYQPSNKMKSLKWSQEVYMVEKVFKPQEDYTAFTYKLKGLSKRYQEQDLQLITQNPKTPNQTHQAHE